MDIPQEHDPVFTGCGDDGTILGIGDAEDAERFCMQLMQTHAAICVPNPHRSIDAAARQHRVPRAEGHSFNKGFVALEPAKRLRIIGPPHNNVAVSGPGAVSSQQPGIACPGDCTESYLPGVQVTLVAVSTSEFWDFESWEGACAGQGRTCTITMSEAISTTAVFGSLNDRLVPPGVIRPG